MFKSATFKKYIKDTSGQFSIIFAIASTVIMMGAAVAVDTTEMHKTRSDLHQIADSAALAGAAASEFNDAKRLQIVKDYIKANSSPETYASIDGTPVIRFDDQAKEITVAFQVKSKTIFASVLGKSHVPVTTSSVATYGQAHVNPVSISFALDVSGSMGWAASDGQIKIDALKDSVNQMFLDIEAEVDDPTALSRTMRTGMSAYHTGLRTSEHMAPGWRNVNNAVDNLWANGGTNSTPSMKFAYNQIIQDRAIRKQKNEADNVREFVIFMTDGNNNQNIWDTNTLKVCSQMKTAGIEVFTVAFAAPLKGQNLLKACATQEEGHYFDAANGAAFRDSFKKIGQEIVEKGVRIKS